MIYAHDFKLVQITYAYALSFPTWMVASTALLLMLFSTLVVAGGSIWMVRRLNHIRQIEFPLLFGAIHLILMGMYALWMVKVSTELVIWINIPGFALNGAGWSLAAFLAIWIIEYVTRPQHTETGTTLEEKSDT